MKTIRLVNNGIFPIVFDESGNKLQDLPDTEIALSGTIQGEGKLTGVPVLFIRTAGCNLRCAWELPNGKVSLCDTPYSSFDVRRAADVNIDAIVNTIKHNAGNIKHLVISGGEPMIQKAGLVTLCKALKEADDYHITIESNATIFIEELAPYINLYSFSPKLQTSVPSKAKLKSSGFAVADNFQLLHDKRRLNIPAIQQVIDDCNQSARERDFQLKFVLAAEGDLKEIKYVLSQLKGWRNEDILLMPLGGKDAELKQSEQLTLKTCLENGWRYCPRIHIQLFGDKHGV